MVWLKICDGHLTCKLQINVWMFGGKVRAEKLVEKLEWNKRWSPPFLCCPVNCQCPWKKAQVEKKSFWNRLLTIFLNLQEILMGFNNEIDYKSYFSAHSINVSTCFQHTLLSKTSNIISLNCYVYCKYLYFVKNSSSFCKGDLVNHFEYNRAELGKQPTITNIISKMRQQLNEKINQIT